MSKKIDTCCTIIRQSGADEHISRQVDKQTSRQGDLLYKQTRRFDPLFYIFIKNYKTNLLVCSFARLLVCFFIHAKSTFFHTHHHKKLRKRLRIAPLLLILQETFSTKRHYGTTQNFFKANGRKVGRKHSDRIACVERQP